MGGALGFSERVIATLALPEYGDLRALFGSTVEAKLQSSNPDSLLTRLLANNTRHLLARINQLCAAYIERIGDADKVRRKCEKDLLRGAGKRSFQEFNGSLGDFMAEMAAVTELAKTGVTDFEPILDAKSKSVDYRARQRGNKVCIEVKNLRAPITVFDWCAEELRRLHIEFPGEFPFHLTVRCESDNTVTPTQKVAITDFLLRQRGRTPPFEQRVELEPGLRVVFTFRSGSGNTMQLRAIRLNGPDTLNFEGFFEKKCGITLRRPSSNSRRPRAQSGCLS